MSKKLPKYADLVMQVPVKAGEIKSIQVLHDDWCDLLARKGPCNCNPEIGTVADITPEAALLRLSVTPDGQP
jgi:hypothetical protein